MEIKTLGSRGFPNYAVMSNGAVFRVDHLRAVKPDINKDGYARVILQEKGEEERFSVHRLVAEIFIPNPEMKPCINHIDNNPANNDSSNLEWVTHQENSQHAVQQGRLGSLKKLTKEEVEYIKNSPLGDSVLAEMFGISRQGIRWHRRIVKDKE